MAAAECAPERDPRPPPRLTIRQACTRQARADHWMQRPQAVGPHCRRDRVGTDGDQAQSLREAVSSLGLLAFGKPQQAVIPSPMVWAAVTLVVRSDAVAITPPPTVGDEAACVPPFARQRSSLSGPR